MRRLWSTANLKELSRRHTDRFIPEIDGLRFFAIALVVAYHIEVYVFLKSSHLYSSGLWIDDLFRAGQLGVQLFFCLSGFILAVPFARAELYSEPKPSLRKYYLRRLRRLEPPYIIALLGMFVALVVARGYSAEELVPGLLFGLVYLYGPLFHSYNPINGVTWSLEVEVQFYVLVPVLATLLFHDNKILRRVSLCTSIVVAGFLQVAFPITNGTVLWVSLPRFIQFFLVGFLVADLYLEGGGSSSKVWDFVWLGAWIALLGVGWGLQAQSSQRLLEDRIGLNLVLPIVCGLLLWGGFKGSFVSRLLRTPWIFTIGGMCYSIYLLHYPLVSFLWGLTGGLNSDISFGLTVVIQLVVMGFAILLVSTAFFIVIERPFMNTRGRTDPTNGNVAKAETNVN